MDRPNVDTDAIFPKQYGRSTARSGYGAVLFDSWRYLDPGDLASDHGKRRPNPGFVLKSMWAGELSRIARQPWLSRVLKNSEH